MSGASLIVCERRGIWALAIESLLAGALPLVPVRSLPECAAALAASPISLLAVELTGTNVMAVLEFVACLPARYPHARAIVVAERRLRGYEPWLREAGAIHFADSPRELGGVAGIAARHLRHAPAPRVHSAQQVWNSLPWREAATA